jgi:hypothetical protein
MGRNTCNKYCGTVGLFRAVPGVGWAGRAMAAGPCHEGAHGVCICRVISICILLVVMNIQKLIYMHVVASYFSI